MQHKLYGSSKVYHYSVGFAVQYTKNQHHPFLPPLLLEEKGPGDEVQYLRRGVWGEVQYLRRGVGGEVEG